MLTTSVKQIDMSTYLLDKCFKKEIWLILFANIDSIDMIPTQLHVLIL